MSKPILSVVIAGSRQTGPTREILDVLQSTTENIECILVTTNSSLDFSPFEKAGFKILRKPVGTTVPCLRAAGLSQASGDIVAMTEDFCLPSPEWATNIVNAHKQSDAIAIGGPVKRRNGATADWALTFCEYARFLPYNHADGCRELPAVNISFKKNKLIECYGKIPEEIEEYHLLPFLLKKGERLKWDNDIYIFDVNDQQLSRSIRSFFFHGRYYGGIRVKNSGVYIKLLRAAASPVIPVLQILRTAGFAFRSGYAPQFIQSLFVIFLLSASWALGEGVGSAFGEGNSKDHWI